MNGGAWKAAVHGAAKSQTRLSDVTFTSNFHALEKEMATHSSVLAWRIPVTLLNSVNSSRSFFVAPLEFYLLLANRDRSISSFLICMPLFSCLILVELPVVC